MLLVNNVVIKNLLTTILVLLLSQCASHINNQEERELNMIKIDKPELYIEEKNPTTAWWLGLLPGGGSFYTRQYGYGTINLLTWPFSMIWDPSNGFGGAQDLNYEATMINIKKKSEVKNVNEKIDSNKISTPMHKRKIYKKRIIKIEEEYSVEQ